MSKKMSLIFMALGLSTGLAVAQQHSDSQLPNPEGFIQPRNDSQLSNPVESKATPTPSVTRPETTSTSAATGMIAEQDANQIRAKELIGVEAVNKDQKLGKVEYLILERDGKVAGVVLSIGGIFGIGDKLVAIPWKQVEVKAGDEPTLQIAMNELQLKAAPDFEPAKAESKTDGLMPETQQRQLQ